LAFKDQLAPEIKRIKSKDVDFRATIHVRDALFKNSYYQLIDYLPTGGNRGQSEGSAAVYYQANELKPDNVASAVSRVFLGIKLECAQCHDHPFAKWSRQQFWELAAFFAGFEQPAMPQNVRQRFSRRKSYNDDTAGL
jgi:hypothetical protein